jgi:voltage-gated potassium channel
MTPRGYVWARREVYRVLDPGARQTPLERAGNIAICLLILGNVAAVIAESVPSLQNRFQEAFNYFETFSVLAFTVEYVLRLWTCVEEPKYRHAAFGRVRYILSTFALLDLLVILPFYLPGVTLDLRFIRVLRLVRMLRVLKFARYSQTLRTFGAVFDAKRFDLAVVLLFLLVLVVLTSSVMYIVENAAQPSQFSSIPAAMWWSVATLTTVGYGDIYPITPLGKLLGAVIALIGIGFFALPAGLLASAFAEEVTRTRSGTDVRQCPHCGETIK